MTEPRPEVSVVVATFERPARLRALLDALGSQRLAADRFEVVVVDDGSRGEETSAALDRESDRGRLRLRSIRRSENGGRARAREDGWRAAQSALIAFVDDDCVPDPGWLEAGLAASAERPGAIVQGRTEPLAEELEAAGSLRRAFTRTIRVETLDPGLQTCNIFYPRELLERVGGFDVERFGRVHGSEDSDLAWRAIESGARATFAADALVRHAVNWLGPLGKLRFAATWELRAYARHPGLRNAHFTHRLFWKHSHYLLVRALCGLALPRRLRFLAPWLVAPYLRHLVERGRVEGGGPLLSPYYLLHDLIELAAVTRAAVRYRTPML